MAPNIECVVMQPKNAFERFFRIDHVAAFILFIKLVRVVPAVPILDILAVMVPRIELMHLLEGINHHAVLIFHLFLFN